MKKLKVFLIILLVLAIAVTALYFWQRENIKSVYYSAKYDDEKIDELIMEQNEDVRVYLEENTQLNVRPSTPVEEKLHQAGVITDEEFVDILTGKTDVKELVGVDVMLSDTKKLIDDQGNPVNVKELIKYKEEHQTANKETVAENEPDNSKKSNNSESGKSDKGSKKEPGSANNGDTNIPQEGTNGNTGQPENKSEKEDITSSATDAGATASECIAGLYALKSSYSAQIDGLVSSAISAYSQLSSEEKKNAKSLLMEYYNSAVSLEGQCDAEVSRIVSQLESTLLATGGDTSIVDKIMSAYSSEKSLKKAQYLNKIR